MQALLRQRARINLNLQMGHVGDERAERHVEVVGGTDVWGWACQLHSVNSAIAYAAKEYASLVELYPVPLSPYAVPGTDLVYYLRLRYAVPATDLVHLPARAPCFTPDEPLVFLRTRTALGSSSDESERGGGRPR